MAFDDSTRQATILVVDDEPELRKLLIRLLESEDFKVVSAAQALEALQMLQRDVCKPEGGEPPIDLVLLDVAMPDMNGMTLFSRMQQDERMRQIPVIFLTGDTEHQQKARAFEAGAVDYITKPFQRKDLTLRIRAHLRDKWKREAAQKEAAGIADRAQMSRNEAEQRFSALVRNSFHLVCELDEAMNVVYASPNHLEILALSPSALEGAYWPEFIPPRERKELIQSFAEILSSSTEKRILIQFRDGANHWRWLDVCGSALKTATGEFHLLLVSRDITHTKETERYLQHLALHDSLTGLANRQRFTNELENLVAAHPGGAPCAVVYVDIDNFKLINDRHGHLIGDQVLRAVAEFLKNAFADAQLISRIGGDEFCVLVHADDPEAASEIGERICEEIRRNPILASGVRHRITLSLGIAQVEANLSTKEVLSRANTALHVAKSNGKNRCCFYRSDSKELLHIRKSAEWFQRIQEGLEESKFQAYYQPLIELRTGKVAYHEALIRFRGENGHLHGPTAFLPSAERYSLMPQIDRYMIRKVFCDLAALPALDVSINLSGSSVTDSGMANYILQSFDEIGIDPHRVIFEITETVFMTNLVQARMIVEALQELGCRFALDDFGSGFSSLNYLRHLPVNIVKIDGSFIKEMHADPVNLTLLKSINEIAHLLGKETVAEWIESHDSLEKLQAIGFDYGQGFYTGKPQPFEKLCEQAASSRSGIPEKPVL